LARECREELYGDRISLCEGHLVTITQNPLRIKVGLATISASVILSISLSTKGQGGGRLTPTPSPKPSVSKPTTPSRKPTTKRESSAPAFRPANPNIELVKISPGTFMMGLTNGEPDEKPVHQVTISYSFYMGKYEVTQAQWQSVMGNNPSNFKDCGGDCPVDSVSWDDTQNFIQRLNQINDGYVYRLPTEAEWEYACRAGTPGDYAGSPDQLAWSFENAEFKTHSVGRKRPNAWGLYDMTGNVDEWCEDLYHRNYGGAPADGNAWVNGSDQQHRVVRGGSYASHAPNLVSALRTPYSHNARYKDVGFRVVAVR
jgi:formylglycine-generating enzyme required for sulfatase activity